MSYSMTMVPVKKLRGGQTWGSRTFIEKFSGIFCLYTEVFRKLFLENDRNILEANRIRVDGMQCACFGSWHD